MCIRDREDHLDVRAQGAHFPLGECGDVFSVELDGATRRFQQAYDAFPDGCLLYTSAEMSFSMIPARVAVVPNPLRSASSGVSSFPALSIAESNVSSVNAFGGCV